MINPSKRLHVGGRLEGLSGVQLTVGRLGDVCKLLNIALNTRLCFVLCVLPIKHRPIAPKIAQLSIGLLSARSKEMINPSKRLHEAVD